MWTRNTKSISKRALSSFQKNKERDLAILALLLASGVRLSEAVNLDLRDVNLNMMIIEVTRKGGKRDSVNVAGFAKPYLEAYMSIRQQRYKAEKTDTAFFLSEYRGLPNRIDASSIEKMVAKYSADFKIRVTPTNSVIPWQLAYTTPQSRKFWSVISWATPILRSLTSTPI